MHSVERSSILLVGNYSNRTGYAWNNIYRLFNVIASAMHKQGISVCLSFAELQPPITFIDEDIPCRSFQFDPHKYSLSNLFILAKSVNMYRIKYVYFTDQKSYRWLYLFLRILGVKKIIAHCRVSVPNPYPAPHETGIRRVIKTIIGRFTWVTPDKIYAVSEFVRSRLVHRNCLPEDKVVVIFNGINLDKYRCRQREINNDFVRIFSGARAVEYKGVPTLIRAVRLLLNEHKITDFVVEYAGDGPGLEGFKADVKAWGLDQHFIFLGRLNGTGEVLGKADIVVVPSAWGDACPSSVSEALAAGKPLVTTLAGGIPEIVGGDSNAVLVPPSDERALADELAELIMNRVKRRTLGVRARKRAEEVLDEKDYYNKTIKQLISDLL